MEGLFGILLRLAKARQLLVQGGFAIGKDFGLGGQFLLEFCHPNLEVLGFLGPVKHKVGSKQEVPKDIDHSLLKEIAA